MQSQLRRLICSVVLCFVIAGSASMVLAKKASSSSTAKKPAPAATPTPAPPASQPTPPDNSEVQQAQTSLLSAEAKAKKAYESKPEWTSAQDAVTKAQTESNAAGASVGSGVRSQPEYVEAAANVAKAEDKLQQARDAGADSSEIAVDATELMTARSALGSLQSKASAADPNVVAAKQKLAAANLAMEQLRKSEDAAVQADPDYQTAKKAYDDARSKLASASK